MSFKDRVRIYEGKYLHVWLECKSVEQAKELVDEIEHALKLKELVKQEIIKCKENVDGVMYGLALESLLELSKK